MSPYSRREFMQTGAALVAATAVSSGARADAGKPVRHAVIGVGNQGKAHTRYFSGLENCEVVGLAEVDPARLQAGRALLPADAEVKLTTDFRELLADDSVDSVSIATCDHWHTPVALHALKAGKHVYVEKPCSHNVREGFALADAARKTGKCVQQGTQSRSSEGIQAAMQFMRDGGIGKVRMAKAIDHQLREPIGRAPVADPPEGVNYDLWIGPGEMRPFTTNRWHYNWHWFWDLGCGDIANDGIHQLDVARWGLGVGYPNRVVASGGQLFYDDDHETPDTQVVTFEYDDCYLLYEMRLWTDYELEGHANGNVFYGDKGRVDIGRNGCFVTLNGEEPRRLGDGPSVPKHMANFINAVQANNPSMLTAPVQEGAVSAALCHLGNVATRVGRPLSFDADGVKSEGDEEATQMLGRTYRAGYELPAV